MTTKRTKKQMYFSIQQLQNIDSQTVISGESTQIDYVQGGKYVIECGFATAKAFVIVEDWKVVLESDGNGFFPVSARNYMTGTEYKNPIQWFTNKIK